MSISRLIPEIQVPKYATDELVARIYRSKPEAELLYSIQPGDHGFDMCHNLDEPYIAEGIEMVRKFWLST